MHRLVLLRHAKSDYPPGVGDHDRPLNDRGRRDAPAAGRWLDEHLDWEPGQEPTILVSSARRAQLTWSLASAELSARWRSAVTQDEPRIYEAYVDDLIALLGEQPEDVHTVVVVGHNPGLANLVETLCEPGELVAGATEKFPTSSVAVIDVPVPWSGLGTGTCTLTAFAVPRG